MPDYLHSDAVLTDDNLYRYELIRIWDTSWIADRNDPLPDQTHIA